MIISTIIHGLEVATVFLVGLLTYQLVKCYRAFETGKLGSNAHNSRAGNRDSRSEVHEIAGFEPQALELEAEASDASSIVVEQSTPGAVVREIKTAAPTGKSTEAVNTSTPEPASKAILNDYIGGFFAEPSVPDLEAFRAENAAASSKPASQSEASITDSAQTAENEEVRVSKAQLAEFKAPETIEPVLVKPVRVVDLDEEDTFIVVEDENVLCHASNENVMSDKVVMAMLKEANMVASS